MKPTTSLVLLGLAACASAPTSSPPTKDQLLAHVRFLADDQLEGRGPGSRADALARLNALVQSVATPPRARKPTKPTYGSKQRRLEGKAQRGQVKAARGRVDD